MKSSKGLWGKDKLGNIVNIDFQYHFVDDMLCSGAYNCTLQFCPDNEYLERFKYLKKMLTSKYGEPITNNNDEIVVLSHNQFYSNQKRTIDDFLTGVVIGNVMYYDEWETRSTTITLTMASEKIDKFSRQVVYQIWYNTKDKTLLDELEKQKQKDIEAEANIL